MASVFKLKNKVQAYDWGSKTFIAELLGEEVTNEPKAELWMGVHPKGMSYICDHPQKISLQELIEQNPTKFLGKKNALKFSEKLPFLLKVLAAGSPLSIQAHPSIEHAKLGFQRENDEGIALDAFNRSYKDDNHKPEMICALTPFRAMNGFRDYLEIRNLFETIVGSNEILDPILLQFSDKLSSDGLKEFYSQIQNLEDSNKREIVSHTMARIQSGDINNDVVSLICQLHEVYPGDIGVLSPLFLNVVTLEIGEAMFLKAGVLHSYLDGVGIELMANSDNVLRGGLTPKYVDVKELLSTLNFEPAPVKRLSHSEEFPQGHIFEKCVDEFSLKHLKISKEMPFHKAFLDAPGIVICTEGQGEINTTEDSIEISKGDSFFFSADAKDLKLSGNLELFWASIPN